jgi:hypothetical protein
MSTIRFYVIDLAKPGYYSKDDEESRQVPVFKTEHEDFP